MITPINNINSNKYTSLSSKVSFGTNSRVYRRTDGGSMETYTYFYRVDLPWKNFISYIDEHFKDKENVNVVMAACSDGSEAYSFAFGIKEHLKNSDYHKFFPLKCYDLDEEIIRAANTGLILINMDDRFELMRQLNKKMNKYVTREKEEVLNIKTNILHNSKSQANISKPGTYRVNKKIFKNTIFEVGDAFDVLKELEDNSNTIFFFRNALGHLNDLYAKEFAQLASKKLKQGSIIAIGDFDTRWTFIKDHLYRNGFTEIMNNVWQKDSDLKTNLKKFAYKFKQFFKYKCI